MGRRRRWILLKTVVSLALLGWVLHASFTRQGMESVFQRITGIEGPWLLLAIAVQLAAVGGGIVRWHLLLSARGLHLPMTFLARSYLVGRFVGAFTPSTTGLDIYRGVDVARRTGEPGRSANVILVEKAVGLIGLAVTSLLLMPLGAERYLGPSALGLALLIGVGSLAGLSILVVPRLGHALLGLLPMAIARRGAQVLGAVGTRGMRVATLAQATALGVASHGLTASVFACTALALGLGVPVVDLLIVGNAIVLGTLLPVSIGGVGVREGVAVLLLGTVGIAAGDASLVALLGYLVGQVPAVAGGLLNLGRSGDRAGEATATGTSPGIAVAQ